MIPKTIHYCWFGGNEKTELAKNCIKSWEKYCPDYELIEWNESNYDISQCPKYVREAYEQKKWAFVTDYVRLDVIYKNGGLYFDTDVEVLASFDHLLDYPSFFGFQNNNEVASGLGFGAEKESPIVAELMDDYSDISFIKEDGTLDILACPTRNLHVFTERGLVPNGERQILSDGTIVFEAEVFSPLSYLTYEKNITENTLSIHWYAASWKKGDRRRMKLVKKYFGQDAYIRLKRVKKKIKNIEKKL